MAGFLQNLGLSVENGFRADNPGTNNSAYLLPGATEQEGLYSGQAADLTNRQVGGADLTSSRNQQQGYLNSLQAAISNPAATQSDLSFQRNQQAVRDSVASQAASMRGVSSGLASRLAGQQLGDLSQKQALDSAGQRLAEETALRAQQGTAVTGLRDADQSLALGQTQLNDNAANNLNNLNLDYRKAQQAGTMAQDQNKINGTLGTNQINAGITNANNASTNQATGGFISTLGNVLGLFV